METLVSEMAVISSESKTTISVNGEERKINLDNDGNLKKDWDDIETTDCEAYGVAPSALTTSSGVDYEYVL